MKPANYTEITAVCVHPDHRGRGYAQVLLSALRARLRRVGKFRSCTYFPTITVRSRYTGGREWKSGAACG